MPITIYYFTGTGNSLAIARQLAAELGDTDLVPIPRALAEGPVKAPDGAVGIAFPVYCAGLPNIVARFAERVDLTGADYLFCVCTMGGTGATGAFSDLDVIFGKQNRNLDAGFAFVMPSNFIDRHDVSGTDARKEIFARAEKRVQDAAMAIRERRKIRDTETGLRLRFLRLVRPFFVRGIDRWDEKFFADESCIGCTTCEKVCPVGNITMKGGRPAWHHHCEMCYACVNFCKKKSIQTGEKTKSRGRYTHPDVTVRDMLEQHGRKPDLSSLKVR
jgi:ferredoxin